MKERKIKVICYLTLICLLLGASPVDTYASEPTDDIEVVLPANDEQSQENADIDEEETDDADNIAEEETNGAATNPNASYHEEAKNIESEDINITYNDNENITDESTVSSLPVGWIDAGDKRWYRHEDGSFTSNDWEEIEGKWYYFDAEGWLVRGWLKLGNTWYYLNKPDGHRATSWNLIDGYWYYFLPDGKMVTDWFLQNGTWYYLGENGKMRIGWEELSGKWYYFDKDGKMVTGWIQIDETWYYLNTKGDAATNWNLIDGYWYYFYPNGKMAVNWIQLSGTWYYLGENGKMRTGWLSWEGHWFYLRESGAMVTGWLDWEGNRYYFLSNGVMVTGDYKIGDIPYHFIPTGSLDMGQSVVNYAMQFIGNPYVWGGVSLTNGCDCSGFTMKVFEKFGITIPRTSGEQRGSGTAVGSLSAARPGDLLCYEGHVGIYIGNGQMVNASNSAPYPEGGIKLTSATYKTIITIRRLV
ncbi:NlpC/P60 family protein [Lactonifactor longoviformis]|uniref:C40 family peptidase n=1 Tax=Lactonifactor longoviformis TaxID=341220 RepID=UPI0036F40E73